MARRSVGSATPTSAAALKTLRWALARGRLARHGRAPRASARPARQRAESTTASRRRQRQSWSMPPRLTTLWQLEGSASVRAARSKRIAGSRAPDRPPNQPASAHAQPREHELAVVAAHFGRGSRLVVRLALRHAPDSHRLIDLREHRREGAVRKRESRRLAWTGLMLAPVGRGESPAVAR
jgi:hypothetical protein